MAQALTPGLTVSPAAKVRKIRELPVKGEILVTEGQQVSHDMIVARAYLPGDLTILRIPEKLGVESFEVLKGLRIKVGDRIKVSDLLCEHAGFFGLFKSRFLSPVEGEVEFISERTAHVGIRGEKKPITIDAYVAGKVVAVEPEKAVTIESSGALVQGIFGVGGEKRGLIKVLSCALDHQLQIQDLPADLKGCVVVGGTAPTEAVLRAAAERGACGMVVGAVDDKALAGYLGYDVGIALTGDEDLNMSLIITEGFGQIAMSERVYQLLKRCEGKLVSINGATQVRAGALRPEIIVSNAALEAKAEQVAAAQGLELGTAIRLIRVPYFGLRGKVVELPHAMQEIETGAHARILKAQLEDGRVVAVPRANVEIL